MKNKYHTLLKRLAYTLAVLIVYHFASLIPLPGINAEATRLIAEIPAFSFFNIFVGGNYGQLSFLSVGLMAFINAQIVVQILEANMSKTVTEWSKSGEAGRHKLDRLLKIITLCFGVLQAIAILLGLNELSKDRLFVGNYWLAFTTNLVLLVAGAFVTMWLADRITLDGLGNGSAVIITGNIIAQTQSQLAKTELTPQMILILAVIFFAAMIIMAFINDSELRLKVYYASRDYYENQELYIPFRLLPSSIMPVVFASGLMTVPQIFAFFFSSTGSSPVTELLLYISSLNNGVGILIYAALIIAFSFLYSDIQLNPELLSRNLQKQESYIGNIYPGTSTEQYLYRILNRFSFFSGIFLVIIGVLPLIIASWLPSRFMSLGILGSSYIIVISVIVEMVKQAKGLVQKNSYTNILTTNFKFSKK